MDADGRAVITELCRFDGADRWSILLTFGNLMERRRANDCDLTIDARHGTSDPDNSCPVTNLR
jgi:hypothetical protein